jgi:hypothetical protein
MKTLAFIVWLAAAVFGVFLAGGMLEYADGGTIDYSILLFALPCFLACVALAVLLSRRAKVRRIDDD